MLNVIFLISMNEPLPHPADSRDRPDLDGAEQMHALGSTSSGENRSLVDSSSGETVSPTEALCLLDRIEQKAGVIAYK